MGSHAMSSPVLSRARALDQFYTAADVATSCVAQVRRLVGGDALWVEPAAGGGAFLRLLPHPRTGLDIAPADPSVEQADFLHWRPPATSGPVVVVGNPPFGKNSSLAVRFFNHAALFADLIAFIVPRTFQKESTWSKLAGHMELLEETRLAENSFLFRGEAYDVPTVFQIWRRRTAGGPARPARPPRTHPDFTFLSGPAGADFAFQRVGARAGLVSTEGLLKSPESHYFIKSRTATTDVSSVLRSIDWSEIKHRTAGNPSIGRAELVREYDRWVGRRMRS